MDNNNLQKRQHARRLRIRLAALERHGAAKDPVTGKSELAVSAGKASAKERKGNSAWGLRMALNRWYPKNSSGAQQNP